MEGEPGSAEFYVSLEDELAAHYYPEPLRALPRALIRSGMGSAVIGNALLRVAQRAAEGRHARMRRDTLKLDRHLGDLLAFSGPPE
jgi:preprotein translocase subunit SecA